MLDGEPQGTDNEVPFEDLADEALDRDPAVRVSFGPPASTSFSLNSLDKSAT